MPTRPLLRAAAASLPVVVPATGETVDAAAPVAEVKLPHRHATPGWAHDRVIYEVNVRQFTPEGTFAAFREHLPRLEAMNVGILWLMPIHPIGVKERKEDLGSYYAAADYRAVNPEFGTAEDLRALVADAQSRGMKVILDWVANHTAWDHVWTVDHPEWFTQAEEGGFKPPIEDWADVIDLNYDNAEMRRAMTDAMRYWVEEVGVDGFRCDVAAMVPDDFWNDAIAELDAIKPVFMLAEGEGRHLYRAGFDATYAWGLNSLAMQVAKGEKTAADLVDWLNQDAQEHGARRLRMFFTSNHDENSWNGSAPERYGDSAEVFAALKMVLPGMPLIYAGQEAGNDQRLKFFTKDQIDWRPHGMADLYTRLGGLKRSSPAMWHGPDGPPLGFLTTDAPDHALAFTRGAADHRVLFVANLSDTARTVSVAAAAAAGRYRDVMTGEDAEVTASFKLALPAWGWRVLYR